MKNKSITKIKKKNTGAPTAADDRRYFGAMIEDIDSKFDALMEGYSAADERLDRMEGKLDEHDKHFNHINARLGNVEGKIDTVVEAVGSLSVNMEIVKQEIEIIKGGLRKKIDVEEFSALESRVLRLERVQGIRLTATK